MKKICFVVAALVTLEDAGNYITKLPKAEHEAPEWQPQWKRAPQASPALRAVFPVYKDPANCIASLRCPSAVR
jgi:hypothetical protein